MPRGNEYQGEPERTKGEEKVAREAANVAKGWPKGAGGEGRVLDPALQRRIDKAIKKQQKGGKPAAPRRSRFTYKPWV